MIKFFRKIRKKLINGDQPTSPVTRYILYAFGEIVLVVFGILIALQINSWSEDRANDKLVAIYKSELINDTLLDQTHFEFHQAKALEENRTIDSLRAILNHPDANEETLKNVIKNSLTFFKRDLWVMPATTELPVLHDHTFLSLRNSGQITLFDNKMQEELASFNGYSSKYSFMIQEIINSKNEIYYDYINSIPAQQNKNSNIVNAKLYDDVWSKVDWKSVQIKFITLMNTYYDFNLKNEYFNSIRLYKNENHAGLS